VVNELKTGWDMFIVPSSVVRTETAPAAKLVYLALCYHANAEAQCFPSVALLAKETGLYRRDVFHGLKELVSIGLIFKERRHKDDGSLTTNLYTLTMHPRNSGRWWNTTRVVEYHGGSGIPPRTKSSELNPVKERKPRTSARHPTLDVPMSQKRYDSLCGDFGKALVEDYMQRVKDYASAKGKRYVDYAAAAANFMKRDGVKSVVRHKTAGQVEAEALAKERDEIRREDVEAGIAELKARLG
jgi:Helix-turn-helix domain